MMERGLNAVLTQVVSRNLFSEPTPRKPSTLPRKSNATPPQLPADSSGTRIPTAETAASGRPYRFQTLTARSTNGAMARIALTPSPDAAAVAITIMRLTPADR